MENIKPTIIMLEIILSQIVNLRENRSHNELIEQKKKTAKEFIDNF